MFFDVISASQSVIKSSISSPASKSNRRTAESVTTSSAMTMGRMCRLTIFAHTSFSHSSVTSSSEKIRNHSFANEVMIVNVHLTLVPNAWSAVWQCHATKQTNAATNYQLPDWCYRAPPAYDKIIFVRPSSAFHALHGCQFREDKR